MVNKQNNVTNPEIDASYYSTGAHRDKYDDSGFTVLLVISVFLAISLLVSLIPYERIEQGYQSIRNGTITTVCSEAAQVTDGGFSEAYEGVQAFPGLYITEPPEYARSYFNYPKGIYITASEIDCLHPGDIIISVNGEQSPDEEGFLNCLAAATGDVLACRVYRAGEFETVSVPVS